VWSFVWPKFQYDEQKQECKARSTGSGYDPTIRKPMKSAENTQRYGPECQSSGDKLQDLNQQLVLLRLRRISFWSWATLKKSNIFFFHRTPLCSQVAYRVQRLLSRADWVRDKTLTNQ
jgi:hypothetical protein